MTTLYASAFAHSRDGMLITNADGIIVDINPAFEHITGYARADVLGKTPRLLKSGRHEDDFYRAMWQALREEGYWCGEIWNRRQDGEIYPERLSISAIRDDAGQVTHYIGQFQDYRRFGSPPTPLQLLAQQDALTGLPGRALLADRMRQDIVRGKRDGNLLAVGYLDLDGFKEINDRHGRGIGDRLLVEMARRLVATLRASDTVARLGGDEFVVLLPGLASLEECEDTLRRLLAAIAQPWILDDQLISLTASLGVSLHPKDDDDPDALLRHADQAMYLAKQAGRNRYHFHDVESDRRVRSQMETQERIRMALSGNELELHYQPQIDMRNGRLAGVEALLRWQHPQRGLLGPGSFLPTVGNQDLEVRIGEWVLMTALRQLQVWNREGLALRMSVNISAEHIQRDDFLDQLRLALAAHAGVAPEQLELEILETAALVDLERVSDLIRACRRLGSSFALDDFGTGYSSLTYLKHLPVQALKIDQSFVRDMLRDADDLAIVEGVIALAEAFGRHVIAEGVETPEAGLLLLQLGCYAAQGYHIGRPMPAAELKVWLANWTPPGDWSEVNFRRWHKEDFALLLAEYHHREWIDKLVHRVEEATGPLEAIELDPATCRFGHWYLGSGRTRYGHLPEFAAIAAPHRLVHAIGGDIVRHLRAGDPTAARQTLTSLYAARDELLLRLRALQACIQQLADRGAPV